MTSESLSSIRIAPDSAWAARLLRAGRGLELTRVKEDAAERSLLGIGDFRRSAPLSAFGALSEDYLWNVLLPQQRADGAFSGMDVDEEEQSNVQTLEAFLRLTVRWTGRELCVSLLLPCAGVMESQNTRIPWKMATDYPRSGSGSLTFYPETTADFTLLLRLPPMAQAIQISRDGAPCAVDMQGGMVRLPGPWKSGDSVRFGFGIPFRLFRAGQSPEVDRAVERAYPGAQPIEQAIVYHGVRALAPLPMRPGSVDAAPAEERPVAMGVRKDGVLRLNPASEADIDAVQSPFAAPGDLFRTASAEPVLLVSRSLWASVTDLPLPSPIPFVEFAPYETSFDRGA